MVIWGLVYWNIKKLLCLSYFYYISFIEKQHYNVGFHTSVYTGYFIFFLLSEATS